MNDENL